MLGEERIIFAPWWPKPSLHITPWHRNPSSAPSGHLLPMGEGRAHLRRQRLTLPHRGRVEIRPVDFFPHNYELRRHFTIYRVASPLTSGRIAAVGRGPALY